MARRGVNPAGYIVVPLSNKERERTGVVDFSERQKSMWSRPIVCSCYPKAMHAVRVTRVKEQLRHCTV